MNEKVLSSIRGVSPRDKERKPYQNNANEMGPTCRQKRSGETIQVGENAGKQLLQKLN